MTSFMELKATTRNHMGYLLPKTPAPMAVHRRALTDASLPTWGTVHTGCLQKLGD